jgi:SAM-dependent methyltransferase
MVYDLAGKNHWNGQTGGGEARLPSKLNPAVNDMTALLDPYVKPGSRVLEVGCAPGTYLLWCARAKQAQACGVEYAKQSYDLTKQIFSNFNVEADLREQDFMATTFEPESFDLVYSVGVIEHFDDPRPMVEKHFEMLKPGGTAIIAVPHFGRSLYGWLAQRMDRENYDIHNTSIMSERAMAALAPEGADARSYTYGRLSPLVLSWKNFPAPIAKLMLYGLSGVAMLQPFQIKALSPWLVLEMTKRPAELRTSPAP